MLSSVPIRNTFQKRGRSVKSQSAVEWMLHHIFCIYHIPIIALVSHRSTSFSAYKACWMAIWRTSESSASGGKALKFSSQVRLKNGRKPLRKLEFRCSRWRQRELLLLFFFSPLRDSLTFQCISACMLCTYMQLHAHKQIHRILPAVEEVFRLFT